MTFALALAAPSRAADLLFGDSVKDANCAGGISPTQIYAEPAFDVKAIKSGSGSLTVNYAFVERVWPSLIAQATYAVISEDPAAQQVVYLQLKKLAESRVALSTIRKEQTQLCYKLGPNQPCNFRDYELAFQYFSFYAYVANLLKSYIAQQPEAALIRGYLDEGYRKYIKTRVDPNSEGLFALLDGYVSTYSYARYVDDDKLAMWALRNGVKKIGTQITPDGFVRFSSYRGVRSFFYHTYSMNTVLAFGELAERNGIKFFDDPAIGPRVRKTVELSIIYAPKPRAFEEKGFRKTIDGRKAYSTDEKDAKRFIHSQALASIFVIRRRYPELLRDESIARFFPTRDLGSFTDLSVGFVPRCVVWETNP